MPAMHDDVLTAMNAHIAMLSQRMERLVSFDMTHEECINLIAPSEHIPLLTQASKFADVKSSEAWVTIKIPADIDGVNNPRVSLQMRTHAQKEPPLIPRNPYWQQPNANNRHAGEKIIQWMTKELELGRKFGTAVHVVKELNRRCDNGHQLRFMLPPVLHLCSMGINPRMDRWMTKHAAFKPVRFMPELSPPLKKAVQDTAALLTSACLIGEDAPEPVVGEVAIQTYGRESFLIGDTEVYRI